MAAQHSQRSGIAQRFGIAQRSGIARRSGVRGLPSILRTVSSGCVGIGMMPLAAALAGLPISDGPGPNPRLEPPGPGTTAVPQGLSQSPLGAGPAQSGNLPGTGKLPMEQLDSVSAQIANLLSMANPGLEQVVGGVYVGDGRPPVPPKLAAKISRWEFVDMGELLPEFWSGLKEDEPTSRRRATGWRSRKVTDILTWGQCFFTYVSVLAPANPEVIPELMAYMAMVIRASQDFDGLAWARYDAGFLRQATLTGTRLWSQRNATIYTLCFAGKALAIQRCEFCLATSHSSAECEKRGDPDPDLPSRMKTLETAVLALTARQSKAGGPTRATGEPCLLWNRNKCTFVHYRHPHVCNRCGGDHPAISCPNPRSTTGHQSAGTPYGHGGARPY